MAKCTWFFIVVAGELSDRARKSDSKFAAGVYAAENHVCHGMAGFLSQVPAFHNRWGVFLQVVNGNGSPVYQQDDDRLSGFEDRLRQFVLHTGQIEVVTISQMRFAPCFAVDQFILAQHQNDSIAFICRFHGIGNQPLIIVGIVQDGILVYQPVYFLV